MKKFALKALLLTAVSALNFGANAMSNPSSGGASYYRFWQGYQARHLTQRQFFSSLPAFMNLARPVYGAAMNTYLVAIPRADKPSFVPDEFALLGFGSEEDYKSIRQTPTGQAYGDAHWRIFDKETSKSASFEGYVPGQPLRHNTAYDLSAGRVDWSRGYNTFYLGLRKRQLSPNEFLRGLSNHVGFAQESLRSLGLRGYIVIASENYEAAFMNWDSRESMDHAFQSQRGLAVQRDAGQILENLQWGSAEVFNGRAVRPDAVYDTSLTME